MKTIETIAPISLDNLKLYFEDKNTTFLIDYSKSELTGDKLITYLSNLDIPCDVINYDKEFVETYLQSTMIVSLPTVEFEVIRLISSYKDGMDVPFKSLIEAWANKLDSLTLFNMYTLESDEIKSWVKSFPENDTNELTGVNFVSLLKHEETYSILETIDKSKLTYYSKYFNDYMFKGNNLFSYWANENNPLFLLTWSIATGKAKELQEV